MPWIEFLELWFYLSLLGIVILIGCCLRASIDRMNYKRCFEFSRDLNFELKGENEELNWINEGNKRVIAKYRDDLLSFEGENFTNNINNI